MGGFVRDLRHGVRLLARQPGFTVVAVVALALGIGAMTTLFSLAETMVWRPVPGRDPENLVRIFSNRTGNSRYADFEALRETATGIGELAAFQAVVLNLRADGAPQTAFGRLVSGSYFPVLGLEPDVGRLLSPGDDRPGGTPAVVLSHHVWERRFGADRGVVGHQVAINGVSATVVGVAPRGFIGLLEPLVADLWLPVSALTAWRPDADLMNRVDPPLTFHLVGRLAPGSSIPRAQVEVSAVAARLAQAFPATNAERTFTLYRAERLVPELQTPFLAFVGLLITVAGIVLVIACVNLASLLLARAAARGREVGVRRALGAGRARLVRQLLTESLIIAACGGAGGVVVAVWATRAVSTLQLSTPVPVVFDIAVDVPAPGRTAPR